MRKCEYVWTDVDGVCRSKTKILPRALKSNIFDPDIPGLEL